MLTPMSTDERVRERQLTVRSVGNVREGSLQPGLRPGGAAAPPVFLEPAVAGPQSSEI